MRNLRFLFFALMAVTKALPSSERPSHPWVLLDHTSSSILPKIPPYVANQARSDAVKEAFLHAWNGYMEYAFPHDELHPVSNTYGDSRNAWGASAIDALSTAIIMEEADVVNKIVQFVPTINFSEASGTVSLFETTIRYIGGLISAYDFLCPQGPLSSLLQSNSSATPLLTQAQALADSMIFAFKTPSGIPNNDLLLPGMDSNDATNGLATAGSLVLEWQHLSDQSKNPIYGNVTQKAESYLLNPQPLENEPFPGLVGTDISIATGLFVNNDGSWSGGDDSFYEYLIKMYIYDPVTYQMYGNRFQLAADSTMQYLRSEPKQGTVFLSQFDGTYTYNSSQHLTCFDGGTFILAGLTFFRQDYIDFGLELVEGCHNTYTPTATGIGPDSFGWDPLQVPNAFVDFFAENGWYPINPGYFLRPEVLESIYYAYRATGDAKYQEWSWNAFQAINSTCRTSSGFAEVSNVMVPTGGSTIDMQESFLFAEVMKYAYLIHAPESDWQVAGPGHLQKWVYNTEAHPIKVRSLHVAPISKPPAWFKEWAGHPLEKAAALMDQLFRI